MDWLLVMLGGWYQLLLLSTTTNKSIFMGLLRRMKLATQLG